MSNVEGVENTDQLDKALWFITDPDDPCVFGTNILLGYGVLASFLSKKSIDASDTGAKCEDSIAWQVSSSGAIVAFAVCDGVGGSYLGYVASRYLAQGITSALIGWADAASVSGVLTAETIMQELDAWKTSAQQWLDQQPISTDVSPILAQIVEDRRRDGSHSVFFCGYLDLRQGCTSFFTWMGNVTGQVFDRDGNGLLNTSTMLDDRERWTTSYGCLGTPQVAHIPTAEIHRVLVASDGLDRAFSMIANVSEMKAEGAAISELAAASYDDDASILSLWMTRPGSVEVASPEGSTVESFVSVWNIAALADAPDVTQAVVSGRSGTAGAGADKKDSNLLGEQDQLANEASHKVAGWYDWSLLRQYPWNKKTIIGALMVLAGVICLLIVLFILILSTPG